MPECLLPVGIHLYVPEFRNDKVQVGDGFRLILVFSLLLWKNRKGLSLRDYPELNISTKLINKVVLENAIG